MGRSFESVDGRNYQAAAEAPLLFALPSIRTSYLCSKTGHSLWTSRETGWLRNSPFARPPTIAERSPAPPTAVREEDSASYSHSASSTHSQWGQFPPPDTSHSIG
jgi:hypothetical protein